MFPRELVNSPYEGPTVNSLKAFGEAPVGVASVGDVQMMGCVISRCAHRAEKSLPHALYAH